MLLRGSCVGHLFLALLLPMFTCSRGRCQKDLSCSIDEPLLAPSDSGPPMGKGEEKGEVAGTRVKMVKPGTVQKLLRVGCEIPPRGLG